MASYHSISLSGMALFERPIETTIGGIELDLASAPIDPGEHELHVGAAIGGIEIYVPSYVKLVVQGGAAIGGYDVHEGLVFFGHMWRKWSKLFGASTPIPVQAVPAPEQPITIRLFIDSGIGGIDIYRLPPRA